eukprot:4529722-Amphidinium_carterae.1
MMHPVWAHRAAIRLSAVDDMRSTMFNVVIKEQDICSNGNGCESSARGKPPKAPKNRNEEKMGKTWKISKK